jgi:1-phosphatidylinositol-4-phosphate 5-kinase
MSGQKHGWGKYSWPSGATYLGEWKHGCLHGYGTFHSPDGSKYQGNWENNQKKGIGTKWCSNGDRYEGLYLQDQPHGPGRFLFASGDEFDGEFREGKFHGQGTFKWISKHRYDGEWWQGMKHGVGVFTWPDGATYEGFWQKGMQHGIGVFRPARHKSRNTTTTTTIDHTNNAIATANAAIVAAPAAAATAGAHMATVAFHHLSDSAALFRPSSHTFSGLTPLHPLPQPPHAASAAASPPESRPGSPSTPRSPAAASASTKAENFHSSTTATNTHINKDTAASTAVYACDYRLGDLILEEALQPEDLDYVFGTATRSRKYNTDGVRSGGGFIDGNGIQSGLTITIGDINYTTNTTAGGGGGGGGAAPGPGTWKWMAQQSLVPRRRRPKKEERMGEIIYKGSPSFDLMLNLQLGIRYTLTTLSKLPPLTGALEKAHFQEKVWLKFPRQGSEVTPPHPSNDFKWKDYNPIVFRQLRGLFGISNSEYILSTCGDHALREMPSPGKSGSVFFVSQDERFIIKTMRKEEVKLLLRTLPLYYAHVASHPDTLISRFYGIHRITLASGRKVRFVVMNNIFATEMPLHKIYDLKGSTYKRTALGASLAPRSPSKAPKEQADSSSSSSGANLNPASSIIFKDLDLKSAFQLKKPVAERLQRQLAADAEFLQSADVMDYSLLLGVHFRNKKDTTRNKNLNSGGGGGGGDGGGGGGGGGDYNNMRLAHRQKPEQQQLEGPNSATISNETRRTTSSIAVPGPSYPEESENEDEVVTPGSSIHSPSESSTSTQKTPNPILLTTTTTGSDGIATANGVNMTGEVNGDDVSPLVIHNSMSFSAKVSKTHLRQQQQLPPLPAPPAKLPKFGTGLYISRFISWRRDTKEKRRQKAEQATGGLGKVAPPPTPAPPLPLDPLQQDLFSLVAPCSPSLSSSSGTPVAMAAVDAPFTTFHRRATSATAALGSVNSNSLFSSPAAFHVGMAGSSSTAPSSPMVDVQQRPASGPIFRTASAVRDGRTAATATKNNKNSKTSNHAQQQHLKVTYSDQLMEQHAALVASLANWEIRNNVTARPPSAALPHAATRHGEQQQQQNNVEDLKTPSKQPTASHQTTLSKPSNDENTTPVYEKDSSNDENTTPVYEKDSSTIVYRADAVAVPIDSSAVEPTTPSSARVSNIFTYNVNRRSAAATEGEVFITPLTVQTQSKDTTPVISSTVFPGHTQEEDARTSTMQQSLSMSYSEAFDGLSNEEAQAMVSRLTTRLSKPIEERLAFDLLRLARHKMLGAGNGRGRSRGAKDGVASSRLPTAVLAAARHARLNTSISLDRKGMENILENTLASQRTEPAQSLSKYLPALAVPLDPTPGILSVHTVPANGTGAGESGAAGDGEIDKEVALFLGVIDWLQPYNARKRLEYSFKSVFIRGSHAISVCEPRVYAKRFLNLMSRLFVVEKE